MCATQSITPYDTIERKKNASAHEDCAGAPKITSRGLERCLIKSARLFGRRQEKIVHNILSHFNTHTSEIIQACVYEQFAVPPSAYLKHGKQSYYCWAFC